MPHLLNNLLKGIAWIESNKDMLVLRKCYITKNSILIILKYRV